MSVGNVIKVNIRVPYLFTKHILDWFTGQNSKHLQTMHKINVGKKLKTVYGRLENIVGKGEKAGYQHFFSFFCNVFESISYEGAIH